uniref:RING-type domain-containing protein n=1 Tax=Leersia perrieri TaxID=77586 RepID=A0A0D9XWX2_9ORYZ
MSTAGGDGEWDMEVVDDLAVETIGDSTATPPQADDDDGAEDYGPELQALSRILHNIVGIGGIIQERAFEMYQRLEAIAHDHDEQDDLVFDAGGGGLFRGVPASAAAVVGLEKRAFGFDDDHHGGGEAKGCVICMEEFVAGDEVSMMPCSEKHSFHQHCIAEWLGRCNGCVICMEEFFAGDEVSTMPCSEKHSFHRHCIAEWLGRSNLCPLCRHALPAQEQDDGTVTVI